MGSVLVVTTEVVGRRMAGPGIRAYELCRALSRRGLEVTLAAPPPLLRDQPFAVAEASRSSLAALCQRVGAVVVQGAAVDILPEEGLPPLVVDLYDPAVIEGLEFRAGLPLAERLEAHGSDLRRMRRQLRQGDLFLGASERQRWFWLGALAGAGRVNPLTYEGDADLRRLLVTVPFGLPDSPPERRPGALRGKVPGIGRDDLVGVWGGGLWNWFDPQTLVRAVALAADQRPDLRVVFLGAGHPNPSVPRMRAAAEARELARSLRLEGRHVHFLPAWLPYEERGAYLAEADFGVTLHRPGVETELAFRTRVLDYLWAGLPVLSTAGDSLAEVLGERGAATLVPALDVEAVARALVELAGPERRAAMAGASRGLAESFRWSAVVEPLAEFCRSPYRAADAGRDLEVRAPGLARRALRSLRRDGPLRFAARAARYLRRQL